MAQFTVIYVKPRKICKHGGFCRAGHNCKSKTMFNTYVCKQSDAFESYKYLQFG